MAASTRAARIIPLRPMVVPPAATACHEWAEVPGHPAGRREPGRRHDPGDVAHVGRARPALAPSDRRRVPGSPERQRLGQRLADAVGELGLLRRRNSRSFSRTRFARATRPSVSLGRISRMPPRYSRLEPGLGGQRAGLGAFEQPGIERLHDVGARVADVVKDLGEIGDDVGRLPPAVMTWWIRVKSGVCSRSSSAAWLVSSTRVERRPARLGGRGGVRARAVEPELGGDPRLARLVAGRVLARRVPVQHGVAVVEEVARGP